MKWKCRNHCLLWFSANKKRLLILPIQELLERILWGKVNFVFRVVSQSGQFYCCLNFLRSKDIVTRIL